MSANPNGDQAIEDRELPRRKSKLYDHAKDMAVETRLLRREHGEAATRVSELAEALADAQRERDAEREAAAVARQERDAAIADSVALAGERDQAKARAAELVAGAEAERPDVLAMRREYEGIVAERDGLLEWKSEAMNTIFNAGKLTAELYGREQTAIEARDAARLEREEAEARLVEMERVEAERDEARRAGAIAVSAVENLATIVINARRGLNEALGLDRKPGA